ncbi:MAG: PD40 domain-containing protein [Bacteroidales bacterium]|nr:PD40 domain-containing protein [Bacteroidales bacterium]
MLIFSSLFSVNAFAQDEGNFKELFLEAESFFLFEEFKDALPLYQKLLQLDPENFNINYKIGICYLNDPYQVSKSITYLENAIKGTSPGYRINNHRERMAPQEAYYYLGNAYRVNNMLDDAIEMYEFFKGVMDPVVYDSELVEAQIDACEVARSLQASPIYFTSSNLGGTINERFEEINPVISGDESVLVFTRKLQFYDAVFYSRKENGTWSYPVNLTASFGVDGNTNVTGISYDGDELFVYRSDDFDGNIYVSRRKNDQWSRLEKLNDNINTKYWESHASISDDGKTLYFTSNRKGGYGGLDIYKSERREGGNWGPAINLGPVINTKYNEDTPFVTDGGSTIYFSSMGHYNMGGYDIFYSTRLDNGRWSVPVNVGYPLNSTNDDRFFVPTRDGAYAYFSKYNAEDSYGLADLYRMEVFTDLHPRKFILNGIARIEGNISADLTRHAVKLVNARTKEIVDQDTMNADGTYTLDAVSGDFELQISQKDVILASERISIPADNPSNVITHASTFSPASRTEAIAAGPAESFKQTDLPVINTRIRSYDVTTDQSIPIELELETDTELDVETRVNGQLFKTENFEIDQRSFIYMLKPFQGENTLRFTITNREGVSNTLEVTVNYLPEIEELAAVKPLEQSVRSDTNRYAVLGSLAGGNLAAYLQGTDLQELQFSTIGELYEYLVTQSDENNFTTEDVDALVTRYLVQKNLGFFVDELKDQSSDSIVRAVDRIFIQSADQYTPETLLDHLFGIAEQGNYSSDELQDALYRIAATDRNELSVMDLLQSYSVEGLAGYLDDMKQNVSGFPDVASIADHIMKGLEENWFSQSEFETALKRSAYEIDVNFLQMSLLNISVDSLHRTVAGLKLWDQNIRNATELVTYLLTHSESNGYTRKDVLDDIEQIRSNPYYLVEMFRNTLAEEATGSLKIFLQEIDIRGLNIDTYGKLINYLLRQSEYQEFNREMIYQLLIDIIDISDAGEFVDLLLQFADERITSAIYATDPGLYSRPLEVVQYLLAASDEYAYTEQDLLNLLLKIFFERKPLIREIPQEKGWFFGAERPALIKALIIANTVIILLIIVLIFLRRQKRDAQNSTE